MGSGGGGDIKETEGEKALAAITAEMWNMVRTEVEPIKRQYLQDTKVTEADYQQAQNFANVDAQAALGKSNLIPAGVQRTGNLSKNLNQFASDSAQVEAGAKVRANNITDDQKNQAMQSIVNVGLGQQASANRGFMETARTNFNQSVNDSQNRFNAWSNRQSNLGSVAGMGAYQFNKRDE